MFALAPFFNKNSAASYLQLNNDQYNAVAFHFPSGSSSTLVPASRSLLMVATSPSRAAEVNCVIWQPVSCSKTSGNTMKAKRPLENADGFMQRCKVLANNPVSLNVGCIIFMFLPELLPSLYHQDNPSV